MDDDVSFASMVQPNMSGKPRPGPKRLSAGPSFEFRSGSAASSSADLLFSNGKILPLDHERGLGGRRRCLRPGGGRRSADTAPKRVSFQEAGPVPRRSASSPLPARGTSTATVGAMLGRGSRREEEKRKGFLGSIIMACRDCRAVEPSKMTVGNVVN